MVTFEVIPGFSSVHFEFMSDAGVDCYLMKHYTVLLFPVLYCDVAILLLYQIERFVRVDCRVSAPITVVEKDYS